jgi:SAM-dependent methyltransferase
MMFDARAEHTFYAAAPATAATEAELDALAADVRLWVPDPEQVFRGRRVLDVGAGTAPLGALLASRFGAASVVSVELVFERLRAARPWVSRAPALRLVCGDVFSLPLASGAFDLVVANSVLHHFPELDRALGEIVRVLRPGGRYIGREPNFDNPLVRFGVFTRLGNRIFGCEHSANEYPLRPGAIVSAFRNRGCSCSLRFFWRRLRRLRHPVAGVAMSVTAERRSS